MPISFQIDLSVAGPTLWGRLEPRASQAGKEFGIPAIPAGNPLNEDDGRHGTVYPFDAT